MRAATLMMYVFGVAVVEGSSTLLQAVSPAIMAIDNSIRFMCGKSIRKNTKFGNEIGLFVPKSLKAEIGTPKHEYDNETFDSGRALFSV